MNVTKIYPVGFAANSYLLTEDGKTAVAIDPAQPRILEEAQKRGLKVEFVLLTHGHFDHVGGVAALRQAGARVGCAEAEREIALRRNLAREFGYGAVAPFLVDFTVSDGETFELCKIRIRAIATPGHTAGGVSYLAGRCLFTGDSLFQGSVGRCDLPTGNGAQLEQSVRKLYALEGDYTVYPGHGENTTLDDERKYNGYIRP